MFPLLTLFIYANDNTRRFSTFDPFNQTQQDVTIRLVGCVRYLSRGARSRRLRMEEAS